LFVLPPLWWERYPTDDLGRAVAPPFSTAASLHVKHISIAFGSQTIKAVAMCSSNWHGWDNDQFPDIDNRTPAQKLQHSRENAVASLVNIRDFVWEAVRQGFQHLQTIEIDLKDAYCFLGCCRMVNLYWELLADLHLKKIRLLGLQGEAELVETSYCPEEGANLLANTCKLEVNPEEDDWEQWKDANITARPRRKPMRCGGESHYEIANEV
jgi:hypothetical protein